MNNIIKIGKKRFYCYLTKRLYRKAMSIIKEIEELQSEVSKYDFSGQNTDVFEDAINILNDIVVYDEIDENDDFVEDGNVVYLRDIPESLNEKITKSKFVQEDEE